MLRITMSILQSLVLRTASFTYGLATLLLFIVLAFWDGSLFQRATEKEKNELKLGSCLGGDRLHQSNLLMPACDYSAGPVVESV